MFITPPIGVTALDNSCDAKFSLEFEALIFASVRILVKQKMEMTLIP
jgi:hypothetical protein